MPPSSVAASASCGVNRSRAIGAGVASTTPSAAKEPAGDRTIHGGASGSPRSRRAAPRPVQSCTPRSTSSSLSRSTRLPSPRSRAKKAGACTVGDSVAPLRLEDWIRRRARISPTRCPAAARSAGDTAAVLMSATDPALIPPTSGSTRVATTFDPSLSATRGPSARSPIGPRRLGRGATASRARRSDPATPSTPERATGHQRVGTPSARAPGIGRSRPRAQTDAPDAPIGTSSSPSPTARHNSTASGRRPSTPSGPRSTARPANSSLRSAPPSRGDASSTVTRGPPTAAPLSPPVSSQAAARPAIPPPITTTEDARPAPAEPVPGEPAPAEPGPGEGVADAGTAQAPPRSAARTTPARIARKAGSSFKRRGPGEGDPRLLGHPAGFDVEVEEHLEVIRDEADGTDDDRTRPVPGPFADDVEQCRPEPGFGRAARALPGDAPVGVAEARG